METKRGLKPARDYLKYLRAGNLSNFDAAIERFRGKISRNKITLAEVGTTEEELAEMKRKWDEAKPAQMRRQILGIVDRLRSLTEGYKLLIIRVVHETRFLDKVLTNLNHSRIHVNDSWLQQQRDEVLNSHQELGSKQREYYDTLDTLRDILAESSIQLSDVGTSEEELAFFSKLLTLEHLMSI